MKEMTTMDAAARCPAPPLGPQNKTVRRGSQAIALRFTFVAATWILLSSLSTSDAFLPGNPRISSTIAASNVRLFSQQEIHKGDEATAEKSSETTTDLDAQKRKRQKMQLLGLLGETKKPDAVLADPITKEPITISAPGIRFGNGVAPNNKFRVSSPSNLFSGSPDTFLNLLEPAPEEKSDSDDLDSALIRAALPLVPPFLRGAVGESFVPMRDLFTSPAVSYAYERGWRQGFARAGFPGPDVEADMAMDYFAPAVASSPGSAVLVDMSCATGLFTRRFSASRKYPRVLGCDYSESMLTEARRRAPPPLELVRCDVGRIPMRGSSVDALHAGAAMHCWPDLDAAASEIYRVLKPGGRYFATTFLSSYFSTMQSLDGGSGGVNPSRQAFQYFESTDTLRSLLERGGFEPEKISIEVLPPACVVIRCEK